MDIDTVDTQAVQRDVDLVWDSDAAVRQEFSSKETYAAYCIGQERGLIKVIRNQRRAYQAMGGSNDARSRLLYQAAVDKHIEQQAARIWQASPAVRTQFGDYSEFRRAETA